MSSCDLSDRFTTDMEQVLRSGVLPDSIEPTSNEYAGSLSVVQMLSSIDFSKESEKRYTLRQRLLAEIDSREGWSHKVKENKFMNTLFQKPRVTPALSVIILVGFLSMLFANLIWPGSVAAAAQNVLSFVDSLWVGEHTFISPINPDQIIKMEDGSLAKQGKYMGDTGTAGTVPQSGKSTIVEFAIHRFDNLAEAQNILPFQLAQPGYLPEAYVFNYVKIFGEGDLVSANLHYTGPGGDLLFSQRPVGDQTVSIGLPESYVIEPVQVNGLPATWAEHVLMWEVNGVSYLLSSPNLSMTDAIQIAESIKMTQIK